MFKACDVCGTVFDAAPRQKRHDQCATRRASKNRNRATSRENHELTFIGVDGEGVTRDDGTHDYVLLSVGDMSYYRDDGHHLHWREIFRFLYSQHREYPHAVFIGYYLGYDFAQWVKTMPASRGRSLFDKHEIAKRRRHRSGGNTVPFPVYVDEWECDILPGRRFKLRPRGETSWMYVCDVGSFFQRSFLSAINPEDWPQPIVSDEDYDLIREGKSRRAVAQLDDAMILYNLAENRALAALMAVMNVGFTASGIRLNKDQWFGPGQAAQAWMGLIGCPTGQQIRDAIPQWALDAARATYYGGWFEIFAHGHVPGVSYENDEISSYPYTISALPCLLHGEWTQGHGVGNRPGDTDYRMVYAEVWGQDTHVGAMLHRTPRGTILRPHHTMGWYWWHELEAAIGAGLISHIEATEWVNYQSCECTPPLSEIRTLFEQRKMMGKNTPHGKALKLVYNSVYGKCAQSIGHPKYSNAIWASLITAGTRTRILDAIATHPRRTAGLLMVATDGVYFDTPHPTLPFSTNELGKWEQQEKHNLTLFMPGMYWDDKTRDRLKEGKAPQLKSRGVSAVALGEKIAVIDGQFHNVRDTNQWPHTELDINFVMVSPGQALQRNNWGLAGMVFQSTVDHPIFRSVSADPVTKRAAPPYIENGIIRTVPYHEPPFGPLESMPYDGTFGEDIELLLTDEADATSIIGEMLSL